MKTENKKLLYVFITLAILIIATFATTIYYFETKYESQGAGKGKLPLLAKIFAGQTSGTTPLVINFTSLVLYYEGEIKYYWDFGDNETSDEINPIHLYNESGSYNCTLTITDNSGVKSSDTVIISAKGNQAPTVSIFISESNPSRPFIPLLRKIAWRPIYRELIERGAIPTSFLNSLSFVSCRGEASDPEGDEIVSYEWILKPPMYVTPAGQQRKPEYNLSGKEVKIPFVYTYPAGTYDLFFIVTDSKGNKGTNTIKFNVQDSKFETLQSKLGGYKTSFIQNIWHNTLKIYLAGPLGDIIGGILPNLPNFPLLKLFILTKLLKLNINPTGTTILQQIGQFIQKHPALDNIVKKNLERIISLLEKRNPNSPLIDKIEQMLENLGMANKRPVLSNEIPADKTKYLSVDYPEVAITVKDPEGDPFNISIHGLYVNNISLTNQYNNTFTATLKTPLPNLTDIYWNVNVSYSQNKWINATYKFSTW